MVWLILAWLHSRKNALACSSDGCRANMLHAWQKHRNSKPSSSFLKCTHCHEPQSMSSPTTNTSIQKCSLLSEGTTPFTTMIYGSGRVNKSVSTSNISTKKGTDKLGRAESGGLYSTLMRRLQSKFHRHAFRTR